MFRRHEKPSPEVAEARQELVELARKRPHLAVPAAKLGELLPLVEPSDVPETECRLLSGVIRKERAAGPPLLRGEDLAAAGGWLASQWRRACNMAGTPEWDRGRIDPVRLIRLMLDSGLKACLEEASVLGMAPGPAASLLRLTLLPFLTRVRRVLDLDWSGPPTGSCPVCGTFPLLGELRGLEQARFLRCGFCSASWEVPRVFCPFCQCRDHRLLGYLGVEGEESLARANTCDLCHGYVKTVAALVELSVPRLLVADLATLHLDLSATERGYRKPG